MKRLLFIPLVLAAGCSTTGKFENRLVRTDSCDQIFVLSLYGQFGLSSELSARDVASLCSKMGVQNAQK